jgi:hypothetical protein
VGRGDLSEAECVCSNPFCRWSEDARAGPRSTIGRSSMASCGAFGQERRGDLPEKYGKWMTVYQRFRRWSEAGIWEAVATTLAQAMADNSRHSLDSTTVRVTVVRPRPAGQLAGLLHPAAS